MICKLCNLENNTNWWWEGKKNQPAWVCYPCGMDRRQEQLKIDKQWKRDNTWLRKKEPSESTTIVKENVKNEKANIKSQCQKVKKEVSKNIIDKVDDNG